MNKLYKLLTVVFTVIMILWSLVELCALPALFVIVGLLNAYPWEFYAVTVGGYFVLLAACEIAAHFIFKALDKKYTPILERKLESILGSFSKKR